MNNQEDKGPHSRRSIKQPVQGGKHSTQAECPASERDPLELIDRDDRRPGYDPDKGKHLIHHCIGRNS